MKFLVDVTNWLTNSQLYGLNKQEKGIWTNKNKASMPFLTQIFQIIQGLSWLSFGCLKPRFPPLPGSFSAAANKGEKQQEKNERKSREKQGKIWEKAIGQLEEVLVHGFALEISDVVVSFLHPQAINYAINPMAMHIRGDQGLNSIVLVII